MQRTIACCGLLKAITEAPEPRFDARDMRIIDFRCRPPVPAYKVLFDLVRSRSMEANRKNIVPGNFPNQRRA